MELVTFNIPRKQSDKSPIVIAPLGDIQWSGKRGPTAKESLREYLDRTLELGAYYLGMGDYTDFLSPSNRQRLAGSGLYDTSMDVIDDKALDLVLELYQDYLKPTKGRWLGLLHGHHYAMLKTGESTDQRLCQLLDARFLGTSAFIRLQFEIHKAKTNVTIWAHHGCGGGQTAGAPLNKLQNAALGFEADIFVMGHTTKSPATPLNRVIPRWAGKGAPDLVHKKVLLVNSGGFNKSYIQGHKQGRVPMGTYAEQGMMSPTHVGAPIIRIEPRTKDTGNHYQGNRHRTWDPKLTVEV
jgi:hypothetical protein